MTRGLLHGRRTVWAGIMTAALALPAWAQSSFVAPPRSVGDINAVLDQEKPDAAQAARNRADANAEPAPGLEPRAQAQFYFRRAQARARSGRNKEAIADVEQAIAIGTQVMAGINRPPQANQYYFGELSRYQQFQSNQYRLLGDAKRSIEIDQGISQKIEQIGRFKGRFFDSNLRTIIALLQLGDIAQAETYSAKNVALLAEAQSWKNFDVQGSYFAAVVEQGKARIAASRGKPREAELGYHKAQDFYRATIDKIPVWPTATPPVRANLESTIDFLLAYEAMQKKAQGRLSEAEADLRRALLGRLKAVGKYSIEPPQILTMLAQLVGEQARPKEGEQLIRAAIDIYEHLGYPPSVPVHTGALYQLAAFLFSQRRWDDAALVYAKIEDATKDWPPERAAGFRLGWGRIFNAYFTNRMEEGIALARQLIEFKTKRLGETHVDTAMAHAILASGLTFARFRDGKEVNNRDAEALKEFQGALPIILANTRDTEDDDISVGSSADIREQTIVEAYLLLLSRNRKAVPNVEAVTFALGESVRRRSVEKALAASSARAVARDPALADLVRKEQDLQKEIGAQLGALNNMLAAPASERDDKSAVGLRDAIEKMRAQRTAARAEIEKRFPGYADLVSPKPATIDDMRAGLQPGEAFVSLYFGRRGSLMWAIPKEGPVAFASTRLTAFELEKKVSKLREAFESQAASIADIPPFDLALASELYEQVLKPIEGGWRPAKSLIVVTNGALGLLPLGLLPTAPADVKADAEPFFSGYRDVPWLARTHAVTMVPSAAAFRTLRKLPASRRDRDKLMAFGDPLFNAEQAAEAARAPATAAPTQVSQTAMRGLPLVRRAAPQLDDKDTATLGALPRLPDTADEVRSIALALQADPSKVVNLGVKANEQTVKSADLTKYKVLVFATHGLVPGELSGLTQPALALSAPDVAGVDGDGLLTMEEILALRLDADWVVLSACNTGTAAGAGAEAASGLGRAFFYAGTRALLLTNWSVHSASARELVSDLFRRQSENPKLSRGEALRQAMMGMVDGPGYKDDAGRTLFSYAHPLFWAPYTIIGDGGS